MRIVSRIMVVAAAGLSGCVSTYSTDPVMGTNAESEPQTYSVMMFDHPDETVPMPSGQHSLAVAGR